MVTEHKGRPGTVGTFRHQLLTATANSFRFLRVGPLVQRRVSFELAPASISLLVAEVSDQKAEVRVLSVLAAKPDEGYQFQLNGRNT